MSDRRRQAAELWAATHLEWRIWTSEAISSDASFRRYFRLGHEDRCFVVMDAPQDKENIRPFVNIAERLAHAGLHVPAIHAVDVEQGFVLLEDLGDRPYHHVLNDANADELFGDAMAALIDMQTRANHAQLPEYDAALLMRELALFPDWFLARHWHVEPTDDELDGWDMVCATLIRWALDQPQVFCHRDYMPRNLMVTEPNPGIIDFQDAVRGPVSYDPVCLFRDAFLSWPEDKVDAWLETYRQRAAAAGLPVTESAELWQRTCDLMGTQRHLKVIGIFARIGYRDGKPDYLNDTPRFFRYLDHAVARNPELADLKLLIDAWHQRRRLVH